MGDTSPFCSADSFPRSLPLPALAKSMPPAQFQIVKKRPLPRPFLTICDRSQCGTGLVLLDYLEKQRFRRPSSQRRRFNTAYSKNESIIFYFVAGCTSHIKNPLELTATMPAQSFCLSGIFCGKLFLVAQSQKTVIPLTSLKSPRPTLIGQNNVDQIFAAFEN